MSQPPPRRFPPVSGPYGWAGAGFLVAALASQMAAAIFLVWLVVNRDRRVVIPLIICFFWASRCWVPLWRSGGSA